MRLVSTSNWGNVGPNFDGVRLTHRVGIARVDAFYTYVVMPTAGFDRPRTDRRLSGAYSTFNLGKGAVTVDAYLFWKNNLRAIAENGGVGRSDIYTTGVRSVGKIGMGFDYHAELALQHGRVAGDAVSAWAGHWEVGRPLTTGRIGSRVNLEYNYATGDHDAHDGRQQSFDQLYPTNVYGTAGDFGWRNLHEPAASVELFPGKKLKIKTAVHGYWIVDTHDALYTYSGAVFARAPYGADSRVGEDIDTRFIYQMTKHLQVWLGYATLFPGPYLEAAGRHGIIQYPYAMWTWIM
jgi:Alginate export